MLALLSVNANLVEHVGPALQKAAAAGFTEVVKMLVRRGAVVDFIGQDGGKCRDAFMPAQRTDAQRI